MLAGYASGQTGFAFHHVVCQTLVRLGGTPHALTNAVVLSHSVRMMAGRAPREIASLAHALDGGPAEAGRAPDLVERLAARAEAQGLREIGFDPARIPAVLAALRDRAELGNTPPHTPDERELHDLIEASL
ncbi:MAG: hypothetical protein NVS2B6_04620 [Thermoleophilaceae bacterium]